jgi:hypothetical protein
MCSLSLQSQKGQTKNAAELLSLNLLYQPCQRQRLLAADSVRHFPRLQQQQARQFIPTLLSPAH